MVNPKTHRATCRRNAGGSVIKTAIELLQQSAARTPDHPALIDDASDARLTYGEMIAEIDARAAGLAALDLRAGNRLAVVMPGTLDLILTVFAASRIGAVPALVNPRLKPEEISQLIVQGAMHGALVAPIPALIDAVAKALPAGAPLLVPGQESGPARSLASCRADATGLPRPSVDPNDPAYIFYTSGTTGLPKAVSIPHRATEARLANTIAATHLPFGTGNRFLGFMPLNHAIGFYGVLLPCLALNGTYIVQSAFVPEATVAAIERHRITYLFATPTHYHLMMTAPSFATRDVSSVELLCFGAAPSPYELLQRMSRAFKGRLRHIYGTTETMCSLYQPHALERADRLEPTLYSGLRVVATGGSVEDCVAPGEEGELLIDATSDTIFTEYVGRPDATTEKLVGGWYRTGDVVRLNENGSVTLKGRGDDIIRSRAENVHPAEVEEVLATHSSVADVAVIGIPDVRWGELVVACVVGRASGVDPGALDTHCRASELAGYKRPQAFFLLDALPRNASNKVLRRELRASAIAARDAGDRRFVGDLAPSKRA